MVCRNDDIGQHGVRKHLGFFVRFDSVHRNTNTRSRPSYSFYWRKAPTRYMVVSKSAPLLVAS